MKWTDSEDLGIALAEKFPGVDPLTLRFTDLRERWSAALRAAHASIPPVPYGNAERRESAKESTKEGVRTA